MKLIKKNIVNLLNTIKNQIFSEKSYILKTKGTYTFLVDYSATKTQIKSIFKNIFNIEIQNIRTLNFLKKRNKISFIKYKKVIISTENKLSLLNILPTTNFLEYKKLLSINNNSKKNKTFNCLYLKKKII